MKNFCFKIELGDVPRNDYCRSSTPNWQSLSMTFEHAPWWIEHGAYDRPYIKIIRKFTVTLQENNKVIVEIALLVIRCAADDQRVCVCVEQCRNPLCGPAS